MRLEPKFYPNQSDDNHCVQAAVLMALRTLGQEADWSLVNQITGYEENRWTWYPNAAVALAQRVPGTKLISVVDYRQFAERGEAYFREVNSTNPSWFELQKRHASPGFLKEQNAAKAIVANGIFETRIPSRTEIEQLLTSHMLIAIVDSGRLAGAQWSYSHSVLMYAASNGQFCIHDPGLPPRPSWKVRQDTFMAAFKNELLVIPAPNMNFGADVGRNDPCPCESGKKYKKCCGVAA